MLQIKANLGIDDVTQEQFYLRTGIVILYAHWEGFIRKSVEFYLKYINKQKHKLGELRTSLVALDLKTRVNFEQKSKSMLQYYEIVEEFVFNVHEKKANLPTDNAIKKPAPLNSLMLKDIIKALGLDYAPFELFEKRLDQSFISMRNDIAHGKRTKLDVNELRGLLDDVSSLLEIFKGQLLDSIAAKKYLR